VKPPSRAAFVAGCGLALGWTVALLPSGGLAGSLLPSVSWINLLLYTIGVAHLTIASMSLSFHRFHSHKSVELHPWIDGAMQIWLWLVTSMTKADWVSVHRHHHAWSDTSNDPHSPVQRGFWHVFLLGAYDYSRAKRGEGALAIRKSIHLNRLEVFLGSHPLLGPSLLSILLVVLVGPGPGAALSLINFATSPLFAVGGVNALAHTWGYRNHETKDNSRNVGFLLPLNFILCGELDHNNHHARPRQWSFRCRWYEFDPGAAYIWLLACLGLARTRGHGWPNRTSASARPGAGFAVSGLVSKELSPGRARTPRTG
jgi:stearoyl-CoA desaturase (delta-9 desaturase)